MRLHWAAVSSEIVYTMHRADKFYGPERQVLSSISLSFLHGAKIGVLGPNGAGKSTLLRIMAGIEEPSSGVAELDPKASVGFLPQEPELDPAKDVRANVEDGVRELRELLDRFNAISAAFAEPDADFDALLAEQAEVQDRIDRADAWSLDQQLDRAMDALRLPDGDRDVTTLSGGERRRVALCRLLLSAPDLLLLDEPTNHLDAESVAWLERHLESYKGTVMAVTHDRYFLDNVAGLDPRARPGQGTPVPGELLVLARAEGGPARGRGEAERRPPTHAPARARVGAHEPDRAPREVEGAPHRVREAVSRRTRRRASTRSRSTSPQARASAMSSSEPTTCRKGSATACSMEDLTFDLPPGGIVGVIGPNGAGKTTLFRMIAGEEQGRTAARSRSERRSSSPTSTSRAARSTGRTRSGRRSPATRT